MLPVEELIKTEEGCTLLLKQIKYPNGYECGECGCNEKYDLRTRPLEQCANCGDQSSLTAGTLFHGLKTPLVKMFAILADLANGVAKSAFAISVALGLPLSTTWRLLHRFRTVIEESFPSDEHGKAHHSLLHKVLYRRTVESLPSEMPDFKAAAIDEVMMTTESTAVGVLSQFKGIEQMLHQAGDGKIVAATIQFIADIFDGVSRKYSQKYAALFAFINRGGCTFEALLTACVFRDPISDHEIASYSSPEHLNVPALLYPQPSELPLMQ